MSFLEIKVNHMKSLQIHWNFTVKSTEKLGIFNKKWNIDGISWEFPVNSEELPGKSSQIQGKRN